LQQQRQEKFLFEVGLLQVQHYIAVLLSFSVNFSVVLPTRVCGYFWLHETHVFSTNKPGYFEKPEIAIAFKY